MQGPHDVDGLTIPGVVRHVSVNETETCQLTAQPRPLSRGQADGDRPQPRPDRIAKIPGLPPLTLQRLREDGVGEVLTGGPTSDEQSAEGEEVVQLRLVDSLDPVLGGIEPRLRAAQLQEPVSGCGVRIVHIIQLSRVSGKPPVPSTPRGR